MTTAPVLLSVGSAKSDTGGVFGVKENTQASTARNERISPVNTLSETTKLGCVVTARCSTKEC